MCGNIVNLTCPFSFWFSNVFYDIGSFCSLSKILVCFSVGSGYYFRNAMCHIPDVTDSLNDFVSLIMSSMLYSMITMFMFINLLISMTPTYKFSLRAKCVKNLFFWMFIFISIFSVFIELFECVFCVFTVVDNEDYLVSKHKKGMNRSEYTLSFFNAISSQLFLHCIVLALSHFVGVLFS